LAAAPLHLLRKPGAKFLRRRGHRQRTGALPRAWQHLHGDSERLLRQGAGRDGMQARVVGLGRDHRPPDPHGGERRRRWSRGREALSAAAPQRLQRRRHRVFPRPCCRRRPVIGQGNHQPLPDMYDDAGATRRQSRVDDARLRRPTGRRPQRCGRMGADPAAASRSPASRSPASRTPASRSPARRSPARCSPARRLNLAGRRWARLTRGQKHQHG
jgi:hypothetical protein